MRDKDHSFCALMGCFCHLFAAGTDFVGPHDPSEAPSEFQVNMGGKEYYISGIMSSNEPGNVSTYPISLHLLSSIQYDLSYHLSTCSYIIVPLPSYLHVYTHTRMHTHTQPVGSSSSSREESDDSKPESSAADNQSDPQKPEAMDQSGSVPAQNSSVATEGQQVTT